MEEDGRPPLGQIATYRALQFLEESKESCWKRSVVACVMGASMGVGLGTFLGTFEGAHGELVGKNMREQVRPIVLLCCTATFGRALLYIRESIVEFAMVGGIFAGVECVIERERASHDILNPILAGGVSGAALGGWAARNSGAKNMYVGEYKARLRDGQGSYTFPSGYFHYSGEWHKGKMHGQGEFSVRDGASYEGEFRDGEIEGVGLKRWPNGSSYSGHFQQGEMHGEGVFLSSKGERYEGHWENNQRCGHGELVLSSKDVYSGDFAAHQSHGHGKMVYAATDDVYEGEWIAGVRSGVGLLRDSLGNRLYEGSWVANQRHGDGVGSLPIFNSAAKGSDEVPSQLWYEGAWANDEPTVVMVGSKRSASAPTNDNQEEIGEVDLQELSAELVIEKKQLPILVAVCLRQDNEGTASGDAIRVRGEHGRRFRLRIFEGAIPPQDLERQVGPVAGGEEITKDGEEAEAAETGTEELTKEQRMEEVTVDAVNGLAVFHNLALPDTTLTGDYYLVCESLTSDALPPVFVRLSVIN
ncbi:hypothetical protein BBJ28_00008821 [Nothophytophthora sp. Chile5]|nr:hypothetical protein BBJ28_00008821 [Nothophytophthora sp. Chile5]